MFHGKFLIFAVAVATTGSAQAAAPPLTGTWGGDQSVLILRADGGSLESGCAGGEWTGPATPDDGGRFVVKGHVRAPAAGAQKEQPSISPNVEFIGQVIDDKLVLSIQGDGRIRQLTLKRGVRPRIVRCL